ncbi:MAG TPA: helix-turn-helix transcriptional regulator [Caulobacteraceae bacterium]|jgi:transcriptional regulator with XRE-family HTH domain
MKNHVQIQEPNHLDVALGLHIRQRRKSLGMSQSTLAAAVGLTFQQIQKYERGFNRVSFSRLVDISHALDCRVTDLIADLDTADAASPQLREQNALLGLSGASAFLTAYSALPAPLQRALLKVAVELANSVRAHPVSPPVADAPVQGAAPDSRA